MNIMMKKKKLSISHGTALIISGIVGAVVYLLLFGVDTLVFYNTDWIYNSYNDINQHYLGWVYYRGSDWTFPLGVFSGLRGDESSSIVYNDSIPLLAIFFKIFRSILPEHFQYFGLFTFLSMVLQTVIGNELIYKKTGKIVESMLTSFFFLSATVMWRRMFEHTSLTCHAIILVAIILFLENEDKTTYSYLKWNLLLVLSTLIHAYYIPMIFGFELFYYIKEKKVKEWYVVFIKVLGSICITFFMMYIIGYFYGANYSSEQDWLGQFGTSVNALFTSQGHSLTAMLFGEFNTAWQLEEGYAYLGMGMIFLVVVATVVYIMDLKNGKANKKKVLVFILGFIFAVVSMVPTIRWNWDHVISVPMPALIKKIMGIFRSNGRFIWPTFYLVMTFSFVTVIKKLPRYRMAILGFCAIVQFFDLLPFYGQISRLMSDRINSKCEIEMMTEIPSGIESVMLMGEVNSDEISGFDFYKSVTIGNFAGERHIALSDYYVARKDEGDIAKNRDEAWRELYLGETRANTLYVFSNLPYDLLLGDDILYYYAMDKMIVALDSPINGVENIDIKKGINIIEVDGYVDVNLDNMVGVVVDPVEKASIILGHCLYKELPLDAGEYIIEVNGQDLTGLGVKVIGDGVEYELNGENAGNIIIKFEVNKRQTVYLQLFNNICEYIDIEKLVLYH